MGSDGLFDVIPPQACVNFVRRQLHKDNNLDRCCQGRYLYHLQTRIT